MTDIFLERSFDPEVTTADVGALLRDGAGCLEIHRLTWNGSLLAADGRRLLCWFSGPDAESARIVLREAGVDVSVLWPATVHEAPEPAEANVLVARRFAEAVTLDEIQAIEDAGAWCLETHRVRFARTFFSHDRKRMICLYEAPDAEAVREAQREAGMPVESVWAFRRIGPADLLADQAADT